MASDTRQGAGVNDTRGKASAFPTSFAQQRLWLLEQLEGNLAAYHLPYAMRLRGPLDTDSLRRGLETIVARHESLRTNLHAQDGEPVQVVSPPRPLALPCSDLRTLPPEVAEAAVAAQQRAEAERPFDLRTDLMLRAQLLRLADEQHVLLLTLHHIAADGWSVRVLWRELETLYDAFRQQADPDLPELPVQYVDFAVWQRNQLQGERLAQLLEYWRRQLDGLKSLELPTDHPRPLQQSYRGASHDFELPPQLADRLRQLGRRENVTLHMALLAAFQALLARYSGQEDIAVGLPIAGRQEAELEHLIGFFVNTLVLRTDLSGQPTFGELLARMRRVSLGAYDHQDLPFEKIVEELNPERNLNRSPLVQVLFQLLDFSDSPPQLQGVAVEWLPGLNHRARFDLEMSLWTQPDKSLRGSLVYSTDLFEAAFIERLVGHFRTFLAGIVADPGQPIGQLPLLTEAERHQLLVEWNDTRTEYPLDRCVHELFEAQVERVPDAVAVAFEDQKLTYRELNSRANRLAHYLRQCGVGPEVCVGVCMARSLEMVVGLLGILKAGGAYVPLDPAYPKDRIAFMLQDSRTPVLLTQRRLVQSLPAHAAKVVCMDADWECIGAAPDGNVVPAAAPTSLAYVIYTSGSTGAPKGVAIEHRSTVAFIHWARSVFSTEELSGVLGSTSICFDLSVYELFVPLCSGGRVVLVDDALGLSSLSPAANVKLINTVPSAMAELLRLGAVPDSVVTVNLAGELLSTDLVRAIHRQTKAKRVYDLYGPSEDTTYSTYALRLPEGPATIGRPVAGTQVYVLDPCRQLVPVGVPGELYLGGAGLARGYLDRPELTRERFIANPFEKESRLYRTGDRVRWRFNGTLEFLGRLDDQVKLRGFRIELGEIETVLRQCPGVAQSVVVLREDRPGEKRLVAYCVPGNESSSSAADLARQAREKLPEYMVPSAFVALEQLPLTPNGKVDRRALPPPEQDQPEAAVGYVAPRTALEEQLAAIWAEVLGRERVGVRENFFFDLGGHSLLAARLVSRVGQKVGKSVPLAVMFREPTVAGLARYLERPPPPPLDLVEPLRIAGSRVPILWFGNGRPLAHFAARVPAEHPLYWCRPEYLDGRRLHRTPIEGLADRYCRELGQLGLKGPLVLCGYSFGGLLAYAVARQLQDLGQDAALLFMMEPTPPMSIVGKGSSFHETLRQRVAREVRELRPAGGGATLAGLKRKAKALLHFLTWPLTLAYCEALLACRQPVPLGLRWPYARNIYRRTIRDYAPQPVRSRLILVHEEHYMGGRSGLWAGLARGEFHRHVLPSAGHLDFLTMPYVDQWMGLLLSYLDPSGQFPDGKGIGADGDGFAGAQPR